MKSFKCAGFQCTFVALVLSFVSISSVPRVATAQSAVAYIYVGQSGDQSAYPDIYAYAATSDGKLRAVEGSPFTQADKTGIMIGTSGSHFIFAGMGPDDVGDVPFNYLYAFDAAPNGAIGSQISGINTANYAGGSSAFGAVLDHTGQFIYVPTDSDTIQTYKMSKTGALSFAGATADTNAMYSEVPKIMGTGAFAYRGNWNHGVNILARASDGSLDYTGDPAVKGPSLPKGYSYSFSYFVPNLIRQNLGVVPAITNDPTNHLAAVINVVGTTKNEGCALVSFTVSSKGALTSTNTWATMPRFPNGCPTDMKLSPSGKILAIVYGDTLQFFQFNGASTIKPYAQIVGKSGNFATIAWDSSNHLYALNGTSGRLHVYNVSSIKVAEASGSPYNTPFCGLDPDTGYPECFQNLVVRSTR